MPGKAHLAGVTLLACGLLLSGGVPAFAQQSRANPYTNLFKPPDLKTVARAQTTQPATPARPRVVCGMTIIPVDPNTDPKMPIVTPTDNTRYTMRAVPLAICK